VVEATKSYHTVHVLATAERRTSWRKVVFADIDPDTFNI